MIIQNTKIYFKLEAVGVSVDSFKGLATEPSTIEPVRLTPDDFTIEQSGKVVVDPIKLAALLRQKENQKPRRPIKADISPI
jgi:hypothetical protein